MIVFGRMGGDRDRGGRLEREIGGDGAV